LARKGGVRVDSVPLEAPLEAPQWTGILQIGLARSTSNHELSTAAPVLLGAQHTVFSQSLIMMMELLELGMSLLYASCRSSPNSSIGIRINDGRGKLQYDASVKASVAPQAPKAPTRLLSPG